MSITAEEKARLIKEYAIKEGDTGSPEVQVANPNISDQNSYRAF